MMNFSLPKNPGANFYEVDNRYTHAFVARCPSGLRISLFSVVILDNISSKVVSALYTQLGVSPKFLQPLLSWSRIAVNTS
jgi:hypothetical protein